MTWLQALQSLDWTDPNLRWVLLGSSLLGLAAALLGCFAFLRGRSLMGDSIAHAALPGVCLAFMSAEFARAQGWFDIGSKNLWLLLLGASITGLAAAWCISAIARYSRVKEDAAQAIVLSVFFGAGVVMLTRIQHGGSGSQSGLDKFLFGQAASLVLADVQTMSAVALILCIVTGLFYKELKLLCFDQDFGRGLGFPMARLDGLLLAMIVAAVVIGLQAVGVVLISAMLILPPASARFWTEKLNRMVPLATVLGGLSGGVGAVLSALAPRMPTGPLIVLSATFLFVISVLFAPRRGALSRTWRLLATRRAVQQENMLRDLYELTETAALESGPKDLAGLPAIPLAAMANKRGAAERVLQDAMGDLKRAGLVKTATPKSWRLSDKGLREAYRVVRKHRLWEMFLMYETTLGAQSVDRDADEVEHFLTPEAMSTLEELLSEHNLHPRLTPDGKLLEGRPLEGGLSS